MTPSHTKIQLFTNACRKGKFLRWRMLKSVILSSMPLNNTPCRSSSVCMWLPPMDPQTIIIQATPMVFVHLWNEENHTYNAFVAQIMFKKIAVGMSGGVDSSIAAYLLKKKGYEVLGVYMKNWDIIDEQGICSSDIDFKDAQTACNALSIPLVQVNFVKEYWNEVFLNFIDDYEHGFTPNPDILCNKYVKFNYFYRYAREILSCDAIATGHYANSSFGNYLEKYEEEDLVKLLKARDSTKDQTFFLSQIEQVALRRTFFPLGNMLKCDVKRLARQVGMQLFAAKKESMGICFIGSRNFQNFIREYLVDRPGVFMDVDSGKVVGKHDGIHQWTIGQRANLGGFSQAYFVAKKCPKTNRIYVAAGTNHPVLNSTLFFTGSPHWIRSDSVMQSDCFDCSFKFQHIHDHSYCRVMHTDRGMVVRVRGAKRGLAPGQYAVFYSGDECLGSARIISSGVTDFSLNWLASEVASRGAPQADVKVKSSKKKQSIVSSVG